MHDQKRVPLCFLSRGICSTDEHVKSLVMPLIKPLAAGYKDLYKAQRGNEKLKESKKDEFFGLRDFYRFEFADYCKFFYEC